MVGDKMEDSTDFLPREEWLTRMRISEQCERRWSDSIDRWSSMASRVDSEVIESIVVEVCMWEVDGDITQSRCRV